MDEMVDTLRFVHPTRKLLIVPVPDSVAWKGKSRSFGYGNGNGMKHVPYSDIFFQYEDAKLRNTRCVYGNGRKHE